MNRYFLDKRTPEQTRRTMNEKLDVPALNYEGIIFAGATHMEAVRQVLRQVNAVAGLHILKWARAGYVTNSGRFVDMDEAACIAKKAGQVLLFGALVPERYLPISRQAASPARSIDAVNSPGDAFRFCPELFEHRASVIEALEKHDICWMSDYSAVDCEHDVYGLEVRGIKSREEACRVLDVIRTMFPAWLGGVFYRDYDREWQVDIRCR